MKDAPLLPCFYRSTVGLGTGKLRHIFSKPVVLLANSYEYYWTTPYNRQTAQIVGDGEIFYVPVPEGIRRHLWRVPFYQRIPAHIRRIAGKPSNPALQSYRNGTIPLTKMIGIIREHYRFTPTILQYVSYGYGTSVRLLRSLLGGDYGMSVEAALAIESETCLQVISQLDCKGKPGLAKARERFFKNLEFLEYIRCTFDAVCMTYQLFRKQGARIHRDTIRAIGRMKPHLWTYPETTSMYFKTLCHTARKAYFTDGIVIEDPFLKGLSGFQLMQFSYIARALPPTFTSMVDSDELKAQWKERVQSEPPPENPLWRPFVKQTLAQCRADLGRPPRFHTEPSVSAALGYSRNESGHSAAYQDLILYEIGCRIRDGEEIPYPFKYTEQPLLYYYFPKGFFHKVYCTVPSWAADTFNTGDRQKATPVLTRGSPYGGIPPTKENQTAHFYSMQINNTLNYLLLEGCKRYIRNIEVIPVLPMPCPEKGVKTRVPTMSLTAAHVLATPLRKALDDLLRTHPSTSKSLGGFEPPPRHKGPYYSLDMSAATDYHPFWLTTTVYEELINIVPELEFLREFLPKLFGPQFIIEESWIIKGMPKAVDFLKGVSVTTANGVLGLNFVYVPKPLPMDKFQLEALASTYAVVLEEWLTIFRLGSPSVTTTGQMMGNPGSWPVLALITMFACDQAGLPIPDTCGDDGVISEYESDKHAPFENAVASCGARLNREKSFFHQTKYLMTEVAYDRNKPLKFEVTSFWSAPTGGTKGSVNWFNLADCVMGNYQSHGWPTDRETLRRRGLWKYHRFYYCWQAAIYLGIPIGAPSFMGGINHPYGPRVPTRYTPRWFDYLSSLTLDNLLLHGGLTLVPPNADRRLDSQFAEIYEMDIKPFIAIPDRDDIRPTAEVALARAKNLRTMTSLFTKGWKPSQSTPSIGRIARKVRSRILSAPYSNKRGRFSRLLSDLMAKKERVFDGSQPGWAPIRQFGYSTTNASLFQFPPAFIKRYWDLQTLGRDHVLSGLG
jgi:hypothetical protein